MASEMAMTLASWCWTHPTTEHKEMDATLALVIAEEIDTQLNMIEQAWGIIANVGGGNWDKETTDWQEAAKRFRERWHNLLRQTGGVPSSEVQARSIGVTEQGEEVATADVLNKLRDALSPLPSTEGQS